MAEATPATGIKADMHAEIEEERKAAFPHPELMDEYRNYARGVQGLTLTVEQEEYLERLCGHIISDNVCKKALTSVKGRVRLSRLDVPNKAVQKAIHETWVLNAFRTLESAVHWTTLRDGNCGVVLDWSPEKKRATLVRHPWYNGNHGIYFAYDDRGQMKYSVTEWTKKGEVRRVVMRDDTLERYKRVNGKWEWYQLPEEIKEGLKAGPVAWTDKKGKPLGVAAVHFKKADEPSDSPEEDNEKDSLYGVSMLNGGVLGLQDAINNTHFQILANGQAQGFQIPWAAGVKPVDERGKPLSNMKMVPGTLLWTTNHNARFGVLPPGDMENLIKELIVQLQAFSRTTGIPMHLIAGEWPSGEAMYRAELPLIDIAIVIADSFGPAWSSVFHKATALMNAFGGTSLDLDALITSVFESPERRDPQSKTDRAVKLRPDISRREFLRLNDYSEEEIDKIIEEKEEDDTLMAGALALVDPQTQAASARKGGTKATPSTGATKGAAKGATKGSSGATKSSKQAQQKAA